MQSETYVFFGIVGSGKGTQVKLLMERTGLDNALYMGTGDGFRKLITEQGYTNDLVREIQHKGVLQPFFLTTWIFGETLVKNLKPENNLFVDGFPRDLLQAQAFESAVEFYSRKNIKIINIELDQAEATKRMMLRGRSDDTEDAIANRFKEYMNKVVPTLQYFKNKENYQIININGAQTVEAVHQEIINKLNLVPSN